MRLLSKFFLVLLSLTVTGVSWAACSDLVCGKWQRLFPGYNHVVEIVTSSSPGWDFERRMVGPGRTTERVGLTNGPGYGSGR